MSNGRKLRRSTDNKMIGGVAAGVADFFDIDATIVRVVWAIAALFGGFGIILYLIMWIVVPEAEGQAGGQADDVADEPEAGEDE